MKSVTDYLSAEAIKTLAIPSIYRLGAILARDGVLEFIEFNPLKVVAKISGLSGSSGRTVEFKANNSGLEYKCTCTKKPDWFCKHCVAVGLMIPDIGEGKTAGLKSFVLFLDFS
jgi:uncharacterized Zn finger protein